MPAQCDAMRFEAAAERCDATKSDDSEDEERRASHAETSKRGELPNLVQQTIINTYTRKPGLRITETD